VPAVIPSLREHRPHLCLLGAPPLLRRAAARRLAARWWAWTWCWAGRARPPGPAVARRPGGLATCRR